MAYQRFGIVAKPHHDVTIYLKQAVTILRSNGREVILDQTAADLLGNGAGVERHEIAARADFLIVLGGDGTFLSVARYAVEHQVPVAGINLGTLGFLTEWKKEYFVDNLNSIIQGRVMISERKLLSIRHQGETHLALNDGVVHKEHIARMIRMLLTINGEDVTEVRGDGIVLATPTGSTAYSLSAGGPIVSPEVGGILITPICPHSLTLRPLIVPDTADIGITLTASSETSLLTIDGQNALPLKEGETIKATVHARTLRMVVSPTISYYSLLNKKLKWGIKG
jgi:NAD+ kinase